MRYSLGPLRIDVEQRVVFHDSEILQLSPKSFDILLLLVDNAGQIVSRETIRDTVWPTAFIEEANINNNISRLRATLREHLNDSDPIQTVPKRGYRFTAPISVFDGPMPTAAAPELNVEESVPDATARVEGVLAEPIPETSPAVAVPVQTARRKRLAWHWILALGILPVALSLGAALEHWRTRPSQAALASVRPSLAILNLRNLSDQPEQNWLGTALEEMLGSDLGRGDGVRLVSGQQVSDAERDLQLAAVRNFDNGTLAQIGKRLDCDLALVGYYLPLDNQIRLDLQLRNTRTGQVVSEFTRTTQRAGLFHAMADAGTELRRTLGLPPVQAELDPGLSPDDPQDGMRPYAEGLKLLRDGQPLRAQPLLSEAVEESPKSPEAHQALAEAWSTLGMSDKAVAEAHLALDNSASLPKEQKLAIEGRAYRIMHDWPHALATYTTLHQLYPDELEYALDVARADSHMNKSRQGLDMLRALAQSSPVAAADPRLYSEEGFLTSYLADSRGELVASGEEIRLARLKNSPLLESDGLRGEGWAWHLLGNQGRALDDFRQAEQISTRIGDEDGVAASLTNEGNLQEDNLDPAAGDTFRRALAIYDRLGEPVRALNTEAGLGNALSDKQDWEGARAAYQREVNTGLARRTPMYEVPGLLGLSSVCLGTGDPVCAKSYAEQALNFSVQTGQKSATDYAYEDLAEAEIAMGNRVAARKDLQKSLDIAKSLGNPGRIAVVLSDMSALETDDGNLTLAQQLSDQAATLHALTGGDANAKLLADARLQMEEGHPEAVEAPMTALTTRYMIADPVVNAWRLLGESWIMRGDMAKAHLALDKAETLAHQLKARMLLPAVLLASARLDAAEGHYEKALAILGPLLQQAQRKKALEMELKIRLAQGEIEEKSGKTATAKRTLQGVQTDSAKYSFGLIGQKARKALQS